MLNWLINHSPLLYFTQSVWRDEAFSVLVAEQPLWSILPKFTFEPPLYYILLHFWIKLFGTSEIAIRSLSLVGFSLTVVVVIHWAEKLFHKHWLTWGLPLLFALNPMLLYYAFEVRAYGWYMFFAVTSMYAYVEKKWILWTLSTVLGFYTHTYMIFVPITAAAHWLITFIMQHKPRAISAKLLKQVAREPFIQAGVIVLLSILPWLVQIVRIAPKLKESWYFPVDVQLVTSVLGNMFIGYEGTPWYLWPYTALLSLLLLIVSVVSLKKHETRTRNLYFFLCVFVPLALVIGVSFVKPLFVNRYLIHVTIAQIFLLAFALFTIAKKRHQMALLAIIVVGLLLFNSWYPSAHKKLDIRSTMMQVNALKTTHDVIFAETPLIFFESIYYSKDRSKVFLYNPGNHPFPWYVGDIIVNPSQVARDFPPYPIRTFLIHENGTFDIAYQMPVTAISRGSRISVP